MSIQKIGFVILAVIAILVGLGVLGILDLGFILSQESLIKFAGIIVIVAGLWLGASALRSPSY